MLLGEQAERPRTVLLLRPHLANLVNHTLGEAAQTSKNPEDFRHIWDGDSTWETSKEIASVRRIEEIIEDVADRVGIPINLQEYQLRRRHLRDAHTHDLERAEMAMDNSDIIAMTNPTYGQVHRLHTYLRNSYGALVLLYEERNRIDDLIHDLRPEKLKTTIFSRTEKSKVVSRVFIANLRNETKVEQAFEQAMTTFQ